MNRKNYLIKLIKGPIQIGDIKNKLLSNIDNYDENTIEKLIILFEKARSRQKRIEAGEGKQVLEEIEKEKTLLDSSIRTKKSKTLHDMENKSKHQEQKALNALLDELNHITN